MSFTQSDLANIEAAIVTIGSRGAAEVTINGRTVKFSDPIKLFELRDLIQGQLNQDTYGSSSKVEFKGVSE